tara:strand:+ start:112 stop:423 length:312 start_codon:yes stop_codon:yes gene_type:complete
MDIATSLAKKTKQLQLIKEKQLENVNNLKTLYKRVSTSNNILLGGAKQMIENMHTENRIEKSNAANNILTYLDKQSQTTTDTNMKNRIKFAKQQILSNYKNLL